VVHSEGNKIAQGLLSRVFEVKDDRWRGLGVIREAVLRSVTIIPLLMPKNISRLPCQNRPNQKDVFAVHPQGFKTPDDCSLFAMQCTPSDPVGACMVSAEGTCATYYKYRS